MAQEKEEGSPEPVQVPEGYVYFDSHVLSNEAFEKGQKLYDEIKIRHPDLQEEFVYIYNDFAGYGQCEVLENSLIELAAVLGKTPQTEETLLQAWHLLEAISVVVMDYFQDWVMVDDGAYMQVLVEIFASAVLTLCTKLKNAGLLTPAKIYNMAEILGVAANVVNQVNEMADPFTKAGGLIKAFSEGKTPRFDKGKYDFMREATTLVGGRKYIITEYLASGGFRVTMKDIEDDENKK